MTFRDKRVSLSLHLFSSLDLFVAGLLCIPALVFTHNLYLRSFLFLYFYGFVWFQGKRNSLFMTLFIIFSIIAFNLLVPYGKVLFKIGTFKITQGALLAGLEKAVTLEGLIMLSKATIRSDLHLPGTFGSLISESFQIFEELLAMKKNFDWKRPIESIDSMLLELSDTRRQSATEDSSAKQGRKRVIGKTLLGIQVAAVWLFMFLYK